MRALALVFLVACGSDPPAGVFTLVPDTTTVAVGQTTFIHAYFNNGHSDAGAVAATWSTDPSGIVMLSDASSNYQKVTGLAPGHVLITATAFEETAKVGITVVAP